MTEKALDVLTAKLPKFAEPVTVENWRGKDREHTKGPSLGHRGKGRPRLRANQTLL